VTEATWQDATSSDRVLLHHSLTEGAINSGQIRRFWILDFGLVILQIDLLISKGVLVAGFDQ
jgi:hypothetical protein